MMSTIEADERIEILDNGSHLGWATVTDRTWSYSPTGLPVGGHSLSAVYRGHTSAVWRLTVEEPVHFENFETAALGGFTSIVRQYYSGSTSVTGSVGVDPPTEITDHKNGPGAGKGLFVRSTWSENPMDGKYSTIFTIMFNRTYSVISFSSSSATGWDGNAIADVVALSESGESLDMHNFPYWGMETVTLRAGNGRRIKSLRFRTVPVGNVGVWNYIWVDDMKMTL
jgi:hypothetical protein